MFLCRLCDQTLLLSQDVILVMKTDSESESSNFIEADTKESSTEGSSSDYDTDSEIDLENSGYHIEINPVTQAPSTE